ncbi:MAG TPA: hypothetical protein DEH25_12540 [Chloroflexi bacterium]|nr:hypothetical protein [Chloroflexota bacterium]
MPGATPELLAGCNAGWISDYTYRALYEQLVPVNPVVALGQSGAALPAFTPQLPDFVQPLSVNSASVDSGSLLVTGRVALDGSTGRFLAAFELPENRGTSFIQQGDFRVVLIDKNGHEAALRTWNPDTTNLGPNSPQPFAFTFNNPPDLSAVRLYYQDTLLDELTPGTPPTVTITSPAPPLTSTNTYTLTWGPTPSESTFLVRYSRDHGATWQTLSAPIIGNAYPVDLSTLPGTDHGIFEVIASTGLESAAAQLSGFALENKAPVVRIFTPKADAPFGGSLTFSGSAFDLEDGWLAPGQLSWLGDQDGVLGTGYTLNALLTPGLQRITLQVLDSSAQVGQDERANFTQIFLPLVKR